MERMASPPILAFTDCTEHTTSFFDASRAVLGAALMQSERAKVGESKSSKPHPVQYESRGLTKKERRYNTFERVALSVVFAVKTFRHYLLGGPFVVYSDHQALKTSFAKHDMHGKLGRWLKFLAEYEFKICELAGRKNVAAAYLSPSTGRRVVNLHLVGVVDDVCNWEVAQLCVSI